MSSEEQWWRQAVVYQIYPRSFADANGDGVGDLRGIIGHLDYLEALGVDVVWLSPIYRSPMDDNGYDIADYDDVDPLFGTLADLDELIAGLHARGMKLIMDLVVNHTSDEHPWFVEARQLGSAKRDWYVWRPAREGAIAGQPGAEPTNWGSFFGGPAWSYDEASGEYYLHLFSRKQPDLNWENPQVREAVYAMMRRWVERGVDGFRMDVINLISKQYPLSDGPTGPGEQLSWSQTLWADGPRVQEWLTEMNQAVGLSAEQLFTVGETPGVTIANAREYTRPDAQRLNMVFQFEHMAFDQDGPDKFHLKPVPWPALKQNLAQWDAGLAGQGWNSLYWCNHDQPRVVSRFGDDSPEHRVASAKTLATVLHLHRGTPFIYQGEELGMPNATFIDVSDFRDLESINYFHTRVAAGDDPAQILVGLRGKSRDNARTPMPWSDAPMAGFTTGTPWLPVIGEFKTINAAAQEGDPESVLAHYRRLIELRHREEIVREGDLELLLPDDERLWVFTRTLGAQQWLVLANMTSHAVGVPLSALPSLEDAELVLGSHPGPPTDVQTLRPWESRVYRLAHRA